MDRATLIERFGYYPERDETPEFREQKETLYRVVEDAYSLAMAQGVVTEKEEEVGYPGPKGWTGWVTCGFDIPIGQGRFESVTAAVRLVKRTSQRVSYPTGDRSVRQYDLEMDMNVSEPGFDYRSEIAEAVQEHLWDDNDPQGVYTRFGSAFITRSPSGHDARNPYDPIFPMIESVIAQLVEGFGTGNCTQASLAPYPRLEQKIG